MSTPGERWYRLPIAWLGATILLASIVGCITLVILAGRTPDASIATDSERLLKVPVSQNAEAEP